ncbi:UNVERIFIED_CONTAM: hypothetical protein Sangu_0418900 [Sesamum angustifolium]|uniref:Uncharacterized protein n=1 Tax=Sesamum angustifolium TaxID=2727405 RepID=A0AAW2QT80_9LAMI
MGMGENDGGGDQFNNHDLVVCGAPKSPWKTPAATSPMVDADSESWPRSLMRSYEQRIMVLRIPSPPSLRL